MSCQHRLLGCRCNTCLLPSSALRCSMLFIMTPHVTLSSTPPKGARQPKRKSRTHRKQLCITAPARTLIRLRPGARLLLGVHLRPSVDSRRSLPFQLTGNPFHSPTALNWRKYMPLQPPRRAPPCTYTPTSTRQAWAPWRSEMPHTLHTRRARRSQIPTGTSLPC